MDIVMGQRGMYLAVSISKLESIFGIFVADSVKDAQAFWRTRVNNPGSCPTSRHCFT